MKKIVFSFLPMALFVCLLTLTSFRSLLIITPDEPILIQPLNGSVDVSTSAALTVEVSDPELDEMTVTFYGRKKVNPGESFTIVGLPDTQYYTGELNGGSTETFNAQTQWIVENTASENIVFVTHLGDCTENADDFEVEWQRADAALRSIEDPILTSLHDGIPYGIAVGNHDQTPWGDPAGTTLLYNSWFGESRFNTREYYGGHYGINNDNHYELFSAAGMDFIVIFLEYDPGQDIAVLNWAENLLVAHSNRRAIVVSHYIVSPTGVFGGQGQAIYDGLKDNPNLFLMLGGHYPGEGRRTDTFSGSTIHSLLSNYQMRTNGGDGWMRIMKFLPGSNSIEVKTYSPTLDQWETDADSEFTLSYDMSVPWEVLGSTSMVASGASTSFEWSHLESLTEYEWYVTVDDGSNAVTSTSWSFTTGNLPIENALEFDGVNQYVTFGKALGVYGSLQNMPSWDTETGMSPPPAGNYSLSFNGSNQYVTFGTAEQLGSLSFTLECWFKRTGTGVASTTGVGGISAMVPLISKGADESEGSNLDANYILGIADGGGGNSYLAGDFEDLGGAPNNHPKIGTTPIVLNTWYHAALTFNNVTKEFALFLNGQPEGTSEVLTGIVPQWDSQQHTSLATMLESDGTTTHGFFAGIIDEPRIWDYARSQAEIQSTMNQEVLNESGMIGRWGMNEGSGDVLHPSDNGMGLQTFTLEAWFKRKGAGIATSTGTGGVNAIPLIAKGRSEAEGDERDVNYFLGINNNILDGPLNVLVADFEDFAATGNNNPVIGSTPITEDIWYHAAATFDGTTWKLYLNGVPDGTATPGAGSIPRFDCLQHAGLGTALNSAGDAQGFFNGMLDEVRIWDYARSQEDIQTDMHRQLLNPAAEPNLVSSYNFNRTRGTILPDNSSNPLNGSLMNMDAGTGWVSSTAPIPYYTVVDGQWDAIASWASGQLAPVNAWARVQIDHDIQQNSDEEVFDLAITANGSLTIQPGYKLTVTDELTNEAGVNGLVLESDASGMSSLIHASENVEATAELYLTKDVWHYSSSPLTNGMSEDFLGLYLRSFDETSYDWNPYITQSGLPLEGMRGYAVWAEDTPGLVLFQGHLNNGVQSIPVTSTTPQTNPGWNLVGNPFASSLDWNGPGWDKSAIDNTIYFWEGTGGTGGSGNYHYYVGGGGSGPGGTWDPVPVNDGTNEIPPMQGFFVKANSTGSISVSNETRIHSGQAYYKSGDDQIPLIRLRTTFDEKNDETVIRFFEEASASFDGSFDAIKLISKKCPQLFSTTSNQQDLAVNTLQGFNNETIIPIGFISVSEGLHRIELTEFENFNEIKEIYLQDLKTDTVVRLEGNAVYKFYSSPSDEINRFLLHFKYPIQSGPSSGDVHIYSYGNTIVVDNKLPEKGLVHVYNLLGRKVIAVNADGQSILRFNIEETNGIYTVEFEAADYRTTEKVLVK